MSNLTNKIRHHDVQGVLSSIAGGANLSKQDRIGNTPLHLAVMANDEKITCLLLQHGAPSDIKNAKGKTPQDFPTVAAKHILNYRLNDKLPIKGKTCKKVKI